jgi:hypothetical protein
MSCHLCFFGKDELFIMSFVLLTASQAYGKQLL